MNYKCITIEKTWQTGPYRAILLPGIFHCGGPSWLLGMKMWWSRLGAVVVAPKCPDTGSGHCPRL